MKSEFSNHSCLHAGDTDRFYSAHGVRCPSLALKETSSNISNIGGDSNRITELTNRVHELKNRANGFVSRVHELTTEL